MNKVFFNRRVSLIIVFYLIFLVTNFAIRNALFVLERGFIQNIILNFFIVNLVGFFSDTLSFLYFGALLLLLFGYMTPNFFYMWKRSYMIISIAIYYFAVFFIFSAVAEWFFWEEFGTRFNFIVVDYIIYTRELVGNAIESYAIGPIGASIFIAGALMFALLWPIINKILSIQNYVRPKRAYLYLPLIIIVPSVTFFLLSNYTYNISDNKIVCELAKNGVSEFFIAFKNNRLDYYDFYQTIPDSYMIQTMKDEFSKDLNTSAIQSTQENVLVRKTKTQGPITKPNVIMIVVESLGAKYMNTFGNQENLTPHLDKLAQKSLFFANLYATGTRTVRGIEALTLAIPPTPGTSIVKRPNNENLYSLGTVLTQNGYDLQFIYGGYGYFDNMNYFFENNHFRILDREDFKSEEVNFANIWGICDGDVYSKTLKEADLSAQSKKPFFKLIMTTSNHRPYTFPEGLIDLKSQKSGRRGGVKYTDYAIHQFLSEAKSHSWFDNTIFVIVADHGVGGRGTMEIQIYDYHIPMFIYAPKLIQPKRVDTVASQIDVAPTLLSILPLSYESRFIGRDIFATAPGSERLLMGTFQSMGFYQNSILIVLMPKKAIDFYHFDVSSKQYYKYPKRPNDVNFELAISYYQYADYLLERNLIGE
jgi:phosphoglycerol transferase MdoB-like AlkP superfamily enzyme